VARGVPVKTQAFAGTHFASQGRMARPNLTCSPLVLFFYAVLMKNTDYLYHGGYVLHGISLCVVR